MSDQSAEGLEEEHSQYRSLKKVNAFDFLTPLYSLNVFLMNYICIFKLNLRLLIVFYGFFKNAQGQFVHPQDIKGGYSAWSGPLHCAKF